MKHLAVAAWETLGDPEQWHVSNVIVANCRTTAAACLLTLLGCDSAKAIYTHDNRNAATDITLEECRITLPAANSTVKCSSNYNAHASFASTADISQIFHFRRFYVWCLYLSFMSFKASLSTPLVRHQEGQKTENYMECKTYRDG